MGNSKFTTKRLVMELMTNEQMQELINSQTDEHLRTAYAYMLEQSKLDESNRKWNAIWSISLKKENKVIGHFCFMGAPVNGTVEIGYGIDEPYRRQGYGYEAIKEAVEVAFASSEVFFVRAGIEYEDGKFNEASEKLLLKIGFKKVTEFTYNDEGDTDDRKNAENENAENEQIKTEDINEEKAVIYELEKPKTSFMSVYMCLGMSLGMCFGMSYGNTGVGLSIGLALGVAIGISLDNNDKKKRDDLKKAKKNMQQ